MTDQKRVTEGELRRLVKNAVRAAAEHGLTCRICRVPIISSEGLLARPARLCEIGKTLRASVAAAEEAIRTNFGAKNGVGVDPEPEAPGDL